MKLSDFQKFNSLDEFAQYLIQQGEAETLTEAKKIAREKIPAEKKFQKAILDELRKMKDVFVWKEQAGMFQVAGLPDICAIKAGRFYGFEVKRPFFGKLSPIQEKTIYAIREAGGTVRVITYASEAKEALKDD